MVSCIIQLVNTGARRWPLAASRRSGTDGRGQASATVLLPMPRTGSYFATVSASAANAETIVACGNLAPPTE